MSYLMQMFGLAAQNFLPAATGIAVVIVLIRGFAYHSVSTISNFWVDSTCLAVYVLLPLSIITSVFFVSQGVIQNLDGYKRVTTVTATTYGNPKMDASGQPIKDAQGDPATEKTTTQTQTLSMGPIISQEAIKMIGTNGDGPFNVSSVHPYRSPNALMNFAQVLCTFIIPAALCFMFGGMVGDGRQDWAVLAAITVLSMVLAALLTWAELYANPMLTNPGIDQTVGNMESKEVRLDIVASSLFATITMVASCGVVNVMHDSLTALGGSVPMFLMQLDEVVFGGVSSGLYGMLVYAILAVFIAGLMVGHTPEHLSKKIEVLEMEMTSIAILVTPLLVLVDMAVAMVVTQSKAGIFNPGMHGFSEVLYTFSSAVSSNGSAFADLSANTPFYNVAPGTCMWLGRFWTIVSTLAMTGMSAAKKRLPMTAGTLSTYGPLLVVLPIGSVLLVGVLTYIPALAFGPTAEHLACQTHGKSSTQHQQVPYGYSLF